MSSELMEGKSGKVERINEDNGYRSLIEVALNGQSDISVIERLVELQNNQEERVAKKLFNIAMSKFQGELPVIGKDGVVDYSSSKGRTYYRYARIEDIAAAIKPALKAAGLSYRFTQSSAGGMVTVGCVVSHEAGHSEYVEFSGSIDGSGGKDQLKGAASTITYLRRYTLTGALGIVVGGEDDEDFSAPNQQTQLYPDVEFKKNFPAWAKKIKSGSHTPEGLLEYLTSKKILLSQAQYDQLTKVEV